jgi:hypothetical protein
VVTIPTAEALRENSTKVQHVNSITVDLGANFPVTLWRMAPLLFLEIKKLAPDQRFSLGTVFGLSFAMNSFHLFQEKRKACTRETCMRRTGEPV